MGSLGKVAGLIAVAVIAGAEPAFAQGTEQEREACTPDAWRLCGQFIPDADRITDCLRNAGLSAGRFDEFPARPQQTPLLGIPDHRSADATLYRIGWVAPPDLCEEAGRGTIGNAIELD